MKTASDAMKFEDIKLSTPSKLSVRQEAKKAREVNIHHMSSGQIVLFLGSKHRFELTSLYAALVTALLVVKW